MSTVGLITEYNPFHMGHEYHIKKAKELTGADRAVVIMSGNYVQRGTPAFMDKHSRASIALDHGADIVLELPVPFSCASAELFALSAVTLLHKTGIVDHICFGCEHDDLELLNCIANIFVDAKNDSSHQLNALIKDFLKNGESYASARNMALHKYVSESSHISGDAQVLNDIICQPNNILAIEYLKALKITGSAMRPVPLKRTAASYHHDNSNDFMYSASSLRNILCNTDSSDYFQCLGRLCSFDYTYCDTLNRLYPVSESDFNVILGEKLILYKSDISKLTEFVGIDTQLANRIINVIDDHPFTDWKILADGIKTKNIAYTAVSRAILAIALGIKKSHLEQYIDNNFASYVRVLGFKKDASFLLNNIKKHGELTLIGQLSEIKDNPSLNSTDLQLLNHSIYCDELYNMVLRTKYSSDMPNEYKRKLIIK